MLHPGECQPPPPPPPAERVVDLLVVLPTDVLDKILAGLPSRARRCCRGRGAAAWSPSQASTSSSTTSAPAPPAGPPPRASSSAARAPSAGRVSIRGVPPGGRLLQPRRRLGWVRAVAGKRPRSLALALPLVRRLRSLFRCDAAALAELELRLCEIPAPPAGFAGFRRLTRLDLDEVRFLGSSSSKQLEAMVSAAAPTLVELRLEDITGDVSVPGGRWVIRGPNLRRLVLRLRIAGAGLWELGALPNLALARIFLSDSAEDRDYVRMFTAISNVRELHIGNFHMATQAAAINIFRDLLRKFENLRLNKT